MAHCYIYIFSNLANADPNSWHCDLFLYVFGTASALARSKDNQRNTCSVAEFKARSDLLANSSKLACAAVPFELL